MKPGPVWLFDLDNTLHNASHAIFPSINRRMGEYIELHLGLEREAAHALREHYWQRYGATLVGLVRHHGTRPAHFLAETHRIGPLAELLDFDRPLRAMLERLPGRRIVFSNGPRGYALEILRAMKLDAAFDDVFTIERMRYQPKPALGGFRRLLAAHRLKASNCVLVEDSAANLRPAKQLGMRTVWVSRSLRVPPWVDLRLPGILDLGRAAARALGRRGPNPPDA